MKVTFISDLHGEDLWKKAVEKESDLFVFTGDYFDSFFISHKKQLDNFKDLIYFKKNNKDKVIFLLGNHDIHYLLWHTFFYDRMRGSGFSSDLVWKVNNLYDENKELFQVAWQKDNVLATHAGLRQDHYNNDLKRFHENYPEYNYADLLNMLWRTLSIELMKIGRRRGGSDNYGSIFWCDKKELCESPLQGMTQVVGHTPCKDIEKVEVDDRTKLYFIESLIYREDKKENPLFLEMEI